MDKLFTILFKVPELQRKILMTAMFLAIYRVGFYIPLPIVDQHRSQLTGRIEDDRRASPVQQRRHRTGGFVRTRSRDNERMRRAIGAPIDEQRRTAALAPTRRIPRTEGHRRGAIVARIIGFAHHQSAEYRIGARP